MTISEVIEVTDRLTPNAYDNADKVRWLMELDLLIYNDVVVTHEGGEDIERPLYTAGDMAKELIVPEPYAEDIYVNYLQAKIAQHNSEDTKYNKAILFYNDGYERFAKAYNERHPVLPRRLYFRF